MLTGGIYFGEKTIWDGILENMRMTGLWSDDEIDSMKGKTKKEEPQNDLESLVESLLNYKDVLEGKVRDLEQENEKLYAKIERQDEEIEGLQMRNSSNVTEFKKLNCKINTIRARCREEARDLFDKGEWGLIEICRSGENGGDAMYNQLLKNTEGEARELFTRHLFYNLKCVPVNQKCDCGNFKKQFEELQAEVCDLTAENVKIGARNENLKKLLETSIKERDDLKNALHVKECGNVLDDKVFNELKEKYETADLEREHLKTELDKIKGTKKELEAALMATIGTVQRLSAELVKTGKE